MRLEAIVIRLALLTFFVASPLFAQSPVVTSKKYDNETPNRGSATKKAGTKTTSVEVELLQSNDGSGLFSQQWLKALEPLDVKVQIHRPSAKDQPEVKQREVGGLRIVTAVGVIERTGRLVFPDRTFDLGDAVKLREWVEELRTYGALGTPAGQPLWGLTKPQFVSIFDGLTKPIDFSTEGLSVLDLTTKVPLPPKTQIRLSPDARKQLSSAGLHNKVRQELKGLSVGAVLAIGLNDAGLGFHPVRTADGSVELLVEPRQASGELWVIGWPLQRPKQKAAPKFMALVPIEFENMELSDVIRVAKEFSEIPIFMDYAELDAKHVNLDSIKVSFPRKMSNWSIALSRVLVPNRLTHELWQDEGGRVFVWITTTRAARSRETGNAKTEP